MQDAIYEAFADMLLQLEECVQVFDRWAPYVSEEEAEGVLEVLLFLRRRVREMAERFGFPVLLTEEGLAALPQGTSCPGGS